MLGEQNFFSKKDLIASGYGKLFGIDGPKLPSLNMLMIDRITNITKNYGNYKNGFIEAELDINPNMWFFSCHFINDPVMPGCLGLDAMWQLVGFYLGWLGGKGKGRALGVKEVKFFGQVLPTSKKIIYHVHLRRIISNKSIVGIADGELLCDNKLIYTANNLKVGLFTTKTNLV
ncbi:MAG: bifunctional 3-hydroxydecanoyl-ACP dehydratase/trans-2-decenoyl-ACP isomerase [Candidatus Lightella neohaematopini]|nr:bifunctional 3-hydroxydecanoyl-ACP dehydratase/trans-2-decenoyl-ACP isomerase [Candidatus Lightella neohaematopini]